MLIAFFFLLFNFNYLNCIHLHVLTSTFVLLGVTCLNKGLIDSGLAVRLLGSHPNTTVLYFSRAGSLSGYFL